MNRSWGTPPWQAETFAIKQPEPIERHSHDVLIVGGGFTGLSAAYHLAQRGVDVALVEASRFGAGASGRTGGLVLEGTAAGVRPGADDCVPFLKRLVAEEHIDWRFAVARMLAHRAWRRRHDGVAMARR